MNSGSIGVKDILSEVVEVIQARSIDNFTEEISDVLYFIYCWLYQETGISLPMVLAGRSITKFEKRIGVWVGIFADNELYFDQKYLVNGSNYERPEKVARAISIARADQVR